MADALRLLMIEDSEEDEMLLARELVRAGYALEYRRVCTAEDIERALDETWDLAISDWSMPQLNGLDAYKIVRRRDEDLPYIIVSGTITEDIAVDALKAGVDDFMSKGKFARLAPAIERVRRDAVLRRRQREADRELERQRQETERSERLLRAVLDSVPDGVLVANQHRDLLACNPAARALFKLEPSDTSIEPVHDRLQFFMPDGVTPLPRDQTPLAKALAGAIVQGQEVVAKTFDGKEVRHLSASARPLLEGSGEFGAVVTTRDITQERATQGQLMVSDRMASVGMLAAGVAHEINNPLAAVLANLDLTSSLVGPSGVAAQDLVELREILDDARTAADRVRQIVRDLKIFSRHEDTEVRSVDIGRTLESTCRMAWNEIRHRARLIKDFQDTPAVRGSESRLGQVFLNLLVNAAQAIPEGSADRNTIRITTRASGDTVAVEVTDTGSGMSPETLRNLFRPFFTTKAQGEGTGLGLAIAYRIVTGLGGTIEVRSEQQRGTTFRVVLPVAVEEATTVPEVSPLSSPPRRGRILVVDDEAMICTAIRRSLSRHHEVHTTLRATDALERVRAGEVFDLVLCDLMMPQMTGMELHAQLRAFDHADRMIFLTGGAFTPAARQFLDDVPNQRIEKPFDPRHLVALVNDRLR